ncbi:hypothetical protein BESB_045970 [Besnoitia besnoiti]|uniref:Protein kinase domain-containing protein n=1 Tax=Besnoitia besnoiti TaxID=94643 RepID=A0A2A9MEI9_BESBE|nr:hypothetical protein BESB_045970 [Besnoitia besnoiti]PFH36405.1 hypothetical protein BESB_045970 [Besnoitia besnoiti]
MTRSLVTAFLLALVTCTASKYFHCDHTCTVGCCFFGHTLRLSSHRGGPAAHSFKITIKHDPGFERTASLQFSKDATSLAFGDISIASEEGAVSVSDITPQSVTGIHSGPSYGGVSAWLPSETNLKKQRKLRIRTRRDAADSRFSLRDRTEPPGTGSGSFIQTPSGLVNPGNPYVRTDVKGRADLKTAVHQQLRVVTHLSPVQREGKEALESAFAEGLELHLVSLLDGTPSVLGGRPRFLGIGTEGVVFEMQKKDPNSGSWHTTVAAKASIVPKTVFNSRMSTKQKRVMAKAVGDRFLSVESRLRRGLKHMTSEQLLLHGLLVPQDVAQIRNLPMFYEAGPYYVLPLVSVYVAFETDLFEVATRPLSVAAKLHVTRQLLYSLAWLHKQSFTHNDFKTENVLVNHEGKVVISDFGFARKVEVEATIEYTPRYLDPQTARAVLARQSSAVTTPKRDAWALGIVLFELWCSSLPYGLQLYRSSPSHEFLQALVAAQKAGRSGPDFSVCPSTPNKVKTLISGLLKWEGEERLLPAAAVDGFISSTRTEADACDVSD